MRRKPAKETAVVVLVLLVLVACPLWAAVSAYRFFGWPGFLWAAVPAFGAAAAFWFMARLIGNWLEACIPAYIVFLLVLMAVPKITDLRYRWAAGAAKEHLGRIRLDLREGRGLAQLPAVAIPPHHAESGARLSAPGPDDAGGWLVPPGNTDVFVNCTHTDVRGQVWHSY